MEKNSILIVDDEAMNITALSQMLKNDYTIYVEKDGQGCIDTAAALKPDLILLDVLMPAMSGFEVIEVLKKDPETRHIPVIFVTGLNNAQDEQTGFVLGAADYVSKPFSSAVVKLRVRNQMQIITQTRLISSLSKTDPLTGIFNRRYFYSELEREWNRAMRQQTPLSILMFDVDKFHIYNETYGHLQGDIVLKEVSLIIKDSLFRAIDVLARWDGERFAILLPDTVQPGANIVAEKIRSTIEKHVFLTDHHLEAKVPTHVTVSVGTHTVIPKPNEDYSAKNFITSVDQALTYAKSTGRNKVSSFSEVQVDLL
ncbi:MAG: diguanylate cyclase [Defluviitaleaceae bacterium]|nr:diguanylate cyclase [Defluviitaleaceae bacterium]